MSCPRYRRLPQVPGELGHSDECESHPGIRSRLLVFKESRSATPWKILIVFAAIVVTFYNIANLLFPSPVLDDLYTKGLLRGHPSDWMDGHCPNLLRVPASQEDYRVSHLAGVEWSGTSYAGRLHVRPQSELFFWYFPSNVDGLVDGDDLEPEKLLIWLQGGPGSSSMLGLFNETGPFNVEGKPNPHTWMAQGYSLLFIDSPVGTGYSVARPDPSDQHESEMFDSDGYARNSVAAARDLLCFFTAWTTLFHKQERMVWVTGESYGGKYVPAFTTLLHKYIEESRKQDAKPTFTVEGIVIASAFAVPDEQLLQQPNHLLTLGLISTTEAQAFKQRAYRVSSLIFAGLFEQATHVRWELIKDMTAATGDINLYNVSLQGEYDRTSINEFMRSQRKALNLPNDAEYSFDSDQVANRFAEDDMHSMLPIYFALRRDFGTRMLLFYGNLDVRDGIPESKWLEFFLGENYDAGRKIWAIKDKTVGYITKIDQEREFPSDVWVANVNNAGHMVPQDQPEACADLLRRFMEGDMV